MTEGNEATAYERRDKVGHKLEPAWLAVRSVERAKDRKMWFFCIERGSFLASYNTTGEEGRVSDCRDAGKEGDDRKKGGEPRVLQCPLEEGKDGDWEIEDEELGAGKLM